MREAILQDNRLSWLQPEGADNDVVLASRILLSRNLRDIPFPNRADLHELGKVEERLAGAIPALQAVTEAARSIGQYISRKNRISA